MKKLEELGISPAPWDCQGTMHVSSNASISNHVCTTQAWMFDRHADARLIAAAPELYECLYDIRYWLGRLYESGNDDSDLEMIHEHLAECRKRSRLVLAKATGEEVSNG